MRRLSAPPLLGLLLLSLVVAAGCARPEDTPEPAAPPVERPALTNRADSVAMRIYEAAGGPEAWASVPYLRFDFASGSDSTRTLRARHLWNRRTGAYRVEIPVSDDSLYVGLFNVDSRQGTVYLNGQPLDSTQQATWLERAYGRFINDTYWLLAPLKVFDPGVRRDYVPDSSDAQQEVITLSFENVGLTPGDRYWFYADAGTGRLVKWAYHLQSFPPDAPAQALTWEDYGDYPAPAGTIHLASRKRRPGGGFTFTDNIGLPDSVAAEHFTDPARRIE